jgi:predicted PurR-regulated permease PerM
MPMLADSIRQLASALIVAAIIVAMLVLGRSVLVPLAGAIILTFMLSPIVRWLMQRGLARGLAVGSVLSTCVGLLIALALLFSTEMLSLTVRLDDYRENIAAKVRSIAAVGQGEGVIGRAAQAIDRIGESITREVSPHTNIATPETKPSPPIEVRNVGDKSNLLSGLEAAFQPLTGAGLTLLFTLFLLLQYEDLRDRVIRILGTDHLSDTTSAMSEAGSRLSRLFLAQAALNVGYAILVGLTLWAVAVPGAIVWAILSGLMRFIPFIGSFISAAPPIVIAAGVSSGWGLFIFTIAFFLVSEMIMGHLLEPMVIGRHVGLSAFAMVAAASFWTLMWGPVGLLLAAPITIVAVVIGRYLPGLAFLSVLLGDEPALEEHEAVYQRLLAADAVAVAERLDAGEEPGMRATIADTIVLPALQLASIDVSRQNLSDRQTEVVRETLNEALSLVIDDEAGDKASQPEDAGEAVVVIVGARGPIDALAADYLGKLLAREAGRSVFASPRESGLTALSAAHAATSGATPNAVIITTTGSASARQVGYVTRRAQTLFPGSRLLFKGPKRTAHDGDFAEPFAAPSTDAIGVRSTAELIALLKLRSADDLAPTSKSRTSSTRADALAQQP